MAEDYYKTLNVSRNATQEEIQKSYRELARKYHPDLNPKDKTAKEKFQKVQAAFDVLSDPEKRKLYDRYGESFEQMQHAGAHQYYGGGGGANGGAEFNFGDFADFFTRQYGRGASTGGPFEDLFRQFAQNYQQREQPRRGYRQAAPTQEAEQEISIPFRTAITGGETHITLLRSSGEEETITVKIPAGLSDGQKIRLRGQGEAAYGMPPGDLVIKVRVHPHRWFTRDGDNLHLKLPVTLAEAALGAKIEVPTPVGSGMITIPPGTSSGTKLRIKGQGIPARKHQPAGDLIVEVQIKLPKELDEEAKELIRQIDERHPVQPRTDLAW